jgi:hypothetical protein
MDDIVGNYRHHKGALYRVVGVVTHTETQEELVIYHNVETPEKVWARPKAMFFSPVEKDGQSVPRFERV